MTSEARKPAIFRGFLASESSTRAFAPVLSWTLAPGTCYFPPPGGGFRLNFLLARGGVWARTGDAESLVRYFLRRFRSFCVDAGAGVRAGDR